jgi:hypothetical protein
MNVSAMGEEWFTAPAPLPHINFLPGFSQEVLGADMGGDSSVSEALGLGMASIFLVNLQGQMSWWGLRQ